MKIIGAYHHYQGNLNHGYEGYLQALRELGHDVPEAFEISAPIQTRWDDVDFLLQFDCCDPFAPSADLPVPNVYWAYDNWQNFKNCRQPGFVGDGHMAGDDRYLPRGRQADVLFSMSVLGVENYKTHGIESLYLPIGADERLEHPPGSVEKVLAVAGICNGWTMDHLPNTRGEMIGAIEREFKNYPTQLSNQVDYFEQGNIYAGAHVGFNYSPCGFDVLNYRPFEIMIAGTCLLTNRAQVPSLTTLGYRENVHFVAYDDEPTLLIKLRWLLENSEERERIAAHGYLETKTNHTMRQRMKVLTECVKKRL